MGEIAMAAMPTELPAAMNIFGGSGDMDPVSAADGSQSGSFDAVLGFLMANSARAQIQFVPEVTETEAPPEMTAADILSEALKGSTETKLPEIFSEKGAKAFAETLARILPEYDGEGLPEETDSLWETVSPEERSAFAELLYAAADISEDETLQSEKSPEDIVRIVTELVVNSAKKPEKKIPEKQEASDEAVLIQGIELFRPVQTVSLEDMGMVSHADSEAVISADAVTAMIPETAEYPETGSLQAADAELPVQPEITEQPKAQSTDDVSFEELQTAYEKLSDAGPEEIVSFCRKLADKLDISAKETVPEAAPETAENSHIGFGRQGMQSFMARVNRHEELPVDTSGEIIPEQTENKGAVTDIPLGENIPESEDVPSQIMRQIDLYKDIFRESFSEREISMKLSPETLGGIEIKIRRSDKGFEITFTAEKQEAAELIGNKASELEEALASRGIALKELSVTSRIVTNETDGSSPDGDPFGNGELYGDAQNGRNSQDRHFSFGGQTGSDSTEQTDESASDINFNREAKLWVSA
ncbi:MAG: flagellar hook-length control protein FliK [Huintestinicola sp.]|uniref:flagellar hook-length control protein FliK n=1 Tax=Huintestinicola sp. TaxID=2981661 RepID=UPI003F045C44